MPGWIFTVQTRKSGDTSGMPTAVFGLILNGRARWSYVYRPSKMFAVTVREYRSDSCTGVEPGLRDRERVPQHLLRFAALGGGRGRDQERRAEDRATRRRKQDRVM